MNPEVRKVLDIMKPKAERFYFVGRGEAAVQMELSVDMACLLVLLAEETEAQSAKAEQQADRVIDLTKTLKRFTVVLIAVGIVQIALMLKSLF